MAFLPFTSDCLLFCETLKRPQKARTIFSLNDVIETSKAVRLAVPYVASRKRFPSKEGTSHFVLFGRRISSLCQQDVVLTKGEFSALSKEDDPGVNANTTTCQKQ